MSAHEPATIGQLLEMLASPNVRIRISAMMFVQRIANSVTREFSSSPRSGLLADDLVQDVLRKLVDRKRDREAGGSLKALLKRMMKNCCIDEWRHAQVKKESHAQIKDVAAQSERRTDPVRALWSSVNEEKYLRFCEEHVREAIGVLGAAGGGAQDVALLHGLHDQQREGRRLVDDSPEEFDAAAAQSGQADDRERKKRPEAVARDRLLVQLAKRGWSMLEIESINQFLGGRRLSQAKRTRLTALGPSDPQAWAQGNLESLWSRLDPIADLIEFNEFAIAGVEQIQLWPRAGVVLLRGVEGEVDAFGDVHRRAADILMRSRTKPCVVRLEASQTMVKLDGDMLHVTSDDQRDVPLAAPPALRELLGPLAIEEEGFEAFERLYAAESLVDHWIAAASVARFARYLEKIPGTAPRPLPGARLWALVRQWPMESIEYFRAVLRERAERLRRRLDAPTNQLAVEREQLASLQLLVSWASDSDEPDPSLVALDADAERRGVVMDSDDLLVELARLTSSEDEGMQWWLRTS